MTHISVVDFKTMEKILLKIGFEPIRQRGSHVFYRHKNGKVTIVPNHHGKDIAKPLIREILREIGLTPEQFKKDLEEL
jgi:predicted RNA binding protein YcfA (HicA-like mRNA interferase family)